MENSVTQSPIRYENQEAKPGFVSSATDTKLGRAVVMGTPILTGAAIACGCAFVGLNDPSSKHVLPSCSFYLLTGYYCPGCGMTRALHSVLNLDLIKALQFNTILVLALPVLAYMYVWWMTWAYSGKELPKFVASKKVSMIVVALVLVFVVGRNFPGPIAEFFARDRI